MAATPPAAKPAIGERQPASCRATNSAARSRGDLPASTFVDQWIVGSAVSSPNASESASLSVSEIGVDRGVGKQLLLERRATRLAELRQPLGVRLGVFGRQTHQRAGDAEQPAVERLLVFEQAQLHVDPAPTLRSLGSRRPGGQIVLQLRIAVGFASSSFGRAACGP